jgi:glycosyltransferase involved in cell wall biosynthesis
MIGAAPIHVLELRSVRGTGGGPEKTILLGAARSDPSKVRVTVCYVRDRRDSAFAMDRRAADMGVSYVEINERHSFDPSIVPALRRVIREQRIDIVHAHDYKTNAVAWLLARLEPVVPLTTAHGWSGTSLRERVYYWFDRRLIARFPIAIAVSEPIRRTLLAAGAKLGRVRRITNAIDADEFRRDAGARARMRRTLGIPADATVIGTIGRLEPVKRHDLVLRAVAGLHATAKPLILLAGEGTCREALSAESRRLGIDDRLMLLGHRDDARDVHQVLDVYVQASDSEGLPNAVLEAMAIGTPVVATNVGGTSELIRDGVDGMLVAPGNVEALRHAIAHTLAEPDAARLRAAAAVRRINLEWSFAHRMAAVDAVYRELMPLRAQSRAAVEICA